MTKIRTEIEPGLLGYCDLIWDQMTAQGFRGDVDELRVISGAAVQHYIFDPAFNRHEEEPRAFSHLALLFNNFGFFESLRYFTGWNVRDFDGISMDDAWTLASHELQEGRALLSADLDGTLQPSLIVGLEAPRKVMARVRSPRGFELETIDYASESSLQRDESFQNFIVMIRPGDGEEALVGPNRQKFELLRWVIAHHQSEKEFFHETRENYASGDRGWQRLVEMSASPDDSTAGYLADHVRFLTTGRLAASRVLTVWSSQLAELVDSVELEAGLAKAGANFGRVAETLEEGDFSAARQCEREAVESLVAASEFFPGRFQPLD